MEWEKKRDVNAVEAKTFIKLENNYLQSSWVCG